MNVVVLTILLSIFLSFLSSKGRLKYGLEYAFGLLAIIGAIHYNYGNDYVNYRIMFDNYCNGDVFASFGDELFRDSGWVALCRICRPIGFFGMVIVLNLLQNFIYYLFVKRNVSSENYWFAVLVYTMSTSMYLVNFSLMRQGLVIALSLLAYMFIVEDKKIYAIPVIIAATTVHTSALIVLPFFFLSFISTKYRRLISVTMVILMIIFTLGGSLLESIIRYFLVMDEFSEYDNMYEYSNAVSFGIGFIADCIPFILAIIYLRRQECDKKEFLFVMLSCVGNILTPFQQIYAIMGRLGWYFAPFAMATVPITYKNLESREITNILLFIFVILKLYRFYLFFNVGAFADFYSQPFETIFSVPWR